MSEGDRLSAQSTQQLFGVMNAPSREGLPTESLPVPSVVDGAASLDDFEVHEKLGAGGNATVSVATWKKTGERVALKIIHGELANDPKYLTRFQREVRASSRLQHPNICRVVAWGPPDPEKTGGKLFLAMEIVEGGTIADLIERAQRLPPQVAASLMVQLLDALGAAHDAGILHRDVKPANAMVTRDGVLKLVDFGIAKGQNDATVTETGFLVGTPAYMSPEQAVGKEIDARTDLYAAGMCFYEMLLGQNPYANDAPSHALLRIASEAMPSVFEQDASVPGVVEGVLERLVERDRNARYNSAAEAIAELRPYLAFVDEVHPNLLRDFVAAPEQLKHTLLIEQAELEMARAERLLLAGDVNLPAAALALFRASSLSNTIQIAHRFEHVCARGNFNFGVADDDALLKARQALRESPNPAGPLKRLADLYRARGDIHRAVVFLRRYLREKPTDSQAQNQLELCVAGVPTPTLTPQGKLQTQDILAGVKTGGWAAVSIDRKELALSLQQPKPGVRAPAGGKGPKLLPSSPPPPAASSTMVVRGPDDVRTRIKNAAAANVATSASVGVGGVRGARVDDDSFGAVASSYWERFGRKMTVAAVFLGAFAFVVWLFSVVVDASVGTTQQVLSDNAAHVGAIEQNDIARRQENHLKDAISHENGEDWQRAIRDVNLLLASKPPASMALDGLLIRARCRVQLRDRESARRDFEEFLAQTPLSDPRRVAIKQQLDAL